jgi:hypothetical protein
MISSMRSSSVTADRGERWGSFFVVGDGTGVAYALP